MLASDNISRTIFKSLLSSLLFFSASYTLATPINFVESLHDGAPGLDNLNCTKAVVNSPDDKFSYSSSYCDDAINIFTRDPVTGKNTFLSSIVGNATTGEGLRSVQWLAMHPSGKYLFAFGNTGTPYSSTNKFRDIIYTFERDTTTGLLTLKSEFDNPLIKSAWNFHISADGHFLYVGRQDGIEVLQISGNGLLTHTQSQHKTSTLSNSSYTRSFVFSPDNKFVYVDSGNNSISWLLRDATSGALTYGGELLSKGMVASTGSLRIRSLGRSNDGKHLYAFIQPNDTDKTTLRHFTIASDGSLTFADDTLTTPASAGSAFYCPSEILISANDKLLYFADGCADNFQVWLRDTATGSLTFIGYDDEGSGKDNIPQLSLSQINNIGFSNDGNFAIAAVDAGVTTFNLTADINLTHNFQTTVNPKGVYGGVITVTNAGPSDAHAIEVSITGNALAGLQTANVSLPQGSCNQNAGTLLCKLPSLPIKASETIELKLVAPDALDALHIDVAKTQAEIDPDNQSDSLGITVQPVAQSSSSLSSSSRSSSSSSQASSVQSSSSSVQSSAQSSSQQSTAAAPTPSSSSSKKGGGSMGFEWLLLLALLGVSRQYKK